LYSIYPALGEKLALSDFNQGKLGEGKGGEMSAIAEQVPYFTFRWQQELVRWQQELSRCHILLLDGEKSL
jgi:hypothetical protein